MALDRHHRIRRQAPGVAEFGAPGAGERPAFDPIECEHAERRNAVLAEILVLVVAPDHHKIGREVVERLARRTEAADQTPAVLGRGRTAFVGLKFALQRLGPAFRILQLGWNAFAFERARQKAAHIGVGQHQPRKMRDPDPKNFAHDFLPFDR